jgi:hypothetical protein
MISTPSARRPIRFLRSGAGLLFSALASVAYSDTLHDIGDGAFQHHDSGWIFPRQIGEFARIGTPQDVDGTIDVVAYYVSEMPDGRTTAIVDVYPKDSAAAQARYDDAVAALAIESHAPVTPLTQSEVRIDGALPLAAVKTFHAGSALYFIDTGRWVIKVRVRSERKSDASLAASEAFVRQQRWDSLTLTKETCTGPACAP